MELFLIRNRAQTQTLRFRLPLCRVLWDTASDYCDANVLRGIAWRACLACCTESGIVSCMFSHSTRRLCKRLRWLGKCRRTLCLNDWLELLRLFC